MDKNQEIHLHERVAKLEVTSDQTNENVKLILENHLPHLKSGVEGVSKDVSEIRSQLSYYAGMGIVVITVLNIIVNIVIKIWK